MSNIPCFLCENDALENRIFCKEHWDARKEEINIAQDLQIDHWAGLPLLEVYPYTVRTTHPKSVPFGALAVRYIHQEVKGPPDVT